jgi:hypothetical protein
MTDRIARGLRRLGIGLAVLVALVGWGVTVKIAAGEYSRPWGWEITPLDGGQTVWVPTLDRATSSGCKVEKHHNMDLLNKIVGLGLGVTAVLALVVWGFFRGLGWLVRAFVREREQS